jgi:hypothetical protein
MEPNYDSWVWVIVQHPEKKAQYVGQFDQQNGVSYIPAFLKKDDALQCMTRIVTDKSIPCEVQAVCFGDLAHDAAQNGFTVLILDEDGRMVSKPNPQ